MMQDTAEILPLVLEESSSATATHDVDIFKFWGESIELTEGREPYTGKERSVKTANRIYDILYEIKKWGRIRIGEIQPHRLRKYEPLLFLRYPPEAESSTSKMENKIPELANVKKLVETGQVSAARRILAAIPVSPGESAELDTWRHVLSPPKTTVRDTASGGSMRENFEWIRDNSYRFKGQWVALNQGDLLGSHKNRVQLHHILKKKGKLNGAMFLKIED